MAIIIQVRQLVSSNVSALVEKAASPHKMLRHLRQQIEESDIALHGELSRMRRQYDRALLDADGLNKRADEWSGKARIAMQKDREDLARAALLAREAGKLEAAQKLAEADRLMIVIAEAEGALNLLQKKLVETNEQLKLHTDERAGSAPVPVSPPAESHTIRRLDHIAQLERRIGFTLGDAPGKGAMSEAEIDAEITAMQRDEQVDAQLAALKAEVAVPAKRKAAARTGPKKAK